MSPPGETRGLSVVGNFTWSLVGHSAYSLAQWGLLIVLAKLGTKELVGEFALALAVAAPAFMFARLQLSVLQATDANETFSFPDYLAVQAVLALAAFVLVVLIAQATYRDAAWIVTLVALAKAIESTSDAYYGAFQRDERQDLWAYSLLLKGGLGAASFAVAFYAFRSLAASIALLSLSWLVVLLSFDRRHAPPPAPSHEVLGPWTRRARLVWLALPLGIGTLFWSFGVNAPRYCVEHFLGVGELGVFASLAYLPLVGARVVGALNRATAARLGRLTAAGERSAFIALLLKCIGLATAVGMVGLGIAWAGGDPLVRAVYSDEYGGRTRLLMQLMLAATLDYPAQVITLGLTALHTIKVQAFVEGVTMVVIAACALTLIPRFGMDGAGWALVAGGATRLLGVVLALCWSPWPRPERVTLP